MRFQNLQKFIFILFLALVIGALIGYKIAENNFDINNIQTTIKNFGIWAPIVFICIYIILTIFLPSTPFMIIAGLIFGILNGLIYIMIGGLISSMLVFWTSRNLGKEWVETILQKKYMGRLNDYNKRLESGAVWDLIAFRIIPIMPFNVLNILMGVSRIATRDYFIGTTLGLLPSSLISVLSGNLITLFLGG